MIVHKRVVGRLRLARGATDRLDQSAGRDPQREAVAQKGRDFAVRQPVAFIEQHREGDGLRAQLHRRGAERIRR